MSKVLILTASMGEGHNTAARNIKEALDAESHGTAEVLVADPYTRTNPVFNRLMQRGYNIAINKYPRAWKVVFNLLSRPGVVEGMGPMLAELTAAVRAMNKEFTPDLLVATYPVFAFLVARLRKQNEKLPPLYTVITDSTMINSSWYRCHCDGFLVADETTASVLRNGKVPEALIHVTGFPVKMSFDDLLPAAHPGRGPWKVVFFPSGRTHRAVETLGRLAEIPNIEVTVVTGRRQAVHRALIKAGLPVCGELLGWTDRMDEIMASSHFYVGKAGGATVQEAIAARLPFLVSHIVPGQEEGNIALIERSGIGALAVGAPARIGDVLAGAVANDGALWKAWRSNLDRIATPGASRKIARFLLKRPASD
jgi:processive 1,2-diacylglycerol beta-glucosyltransferase